MTTTATKERPILFSGPMVRAILEGRKTQTRRIVKLTTPQPSPAHRLNVCHYVGGLSWDDGGCMCKLAAENNRYGWIGDRLWVRETWAQSGNLCEGPDQDCLAYRADGAIHEEYFSNENGSSVGDRLQWTIIDLEKNQPGVQWVKWKPSIHMPRWASRLTLEITDVRVERLQEISEADAVAEGVSASGQLSAVDAFTNLWVRINGDGSFDANPFVWVVSFRKVSV